MGELDDLITKVNKSADIVKVVSSYIPLTKKGNDFVGICPFHDDSRPSFHVSPTKNICKCYACGQGANPISFIQKYEHISFIEALKKAAEIAGISDSRLDKSNFAKKETDPKKAEILKCLSDLTLYYSYCLSTKEGQAGLSYLDSRHLDSNMRTKYKLGYSYSDGKSTIDFLRKKGHSLKTIEDTGITTVRNANPSDNNHGRVIFPISDYEGNVIGFSARRIVNSDEAKYVNSPETYVFHKSNVLYNYHIAKDVARHKKYVYLCEGFMDVFALARIKEDAAVALMGTALTNDHITMLRHLNAEIRICLDGDAAGQNATMKCCIVLKKAGIDFKIVDNQGTMDDPDEILNERGEEALKDYLNNLLTYENFIFSYYTNTNPLKTSEDKKKLLYSFIPHLIMVKSKDPLVYDDTIRKLSKVTHYDPESLKAEVNKYQKSGDNRDLSNQTEITAEEVVKDFSPEKKILRRLLLAEKELLFQMANNKIAVDFYENNVESFYDDIYRQIANFIVNYASENGNIDVSSLITAIELSDLDNKDALINTLTSIILEKNHPNKCDDALLKGLKDLIDKEKKEIYENDILTQSLEGKDELEKARIINEYNRRKAKELKK